MLLYTKLGQSPFNSGWSGDSMNMQVSTKL